MSNCSNCGTEIRSGQKFCHECGIVIKEVSECPDCGTEVLPTQKFCHECGSPIRTVKADKEPKCKISLPEFDIDDSLEYLDAVKICFRQLELDNSYAATLKYAELLQALEENSEALEDEDHEDYWMFSLKKGACGVDECPMRLMILNILHNPSAYEEALQYFEEAVSDPVDTSLIIDDSEPRFTTEAYYGLYGLYLAHSLGHGVPQNKLKACQYLKRFEEHSRHLNLGIQVMLDVHIALAYDALDDNKASVKKYLLKLDKYCKRWSDDYPDGPLLGLFRHSLDMYDEILRECPTVASALPKSWKRNSDK